jgi:hypothetical protein
MAGSRRQRLFGPDEIGSRISRHGIAWNDGLGNGLFESLLIDRKYGLGHTLEAPAVPMEAPFLDTEWPAFEEAYRRRLARVLARLQEAEGVYGHPLVRRESGLCVLWWQEMPLALFARALRRAPDAVGEDLIAAIGCGAPPIEPATARDRAALARFWSFIRRRQGRVLEFASTVLREALGDGTKIVGNLHELPLHDMAALGRTFDHPGLAMRPALLSDEVMLRHYIAYWTQLFRDLTGRPPMVSVRVNLLAAGCRFMPSANLIRRWYDQTVRHGAGGYYFWTRDYPSDLHHDPYDGPIPGNPDPSALPTVRWDTSLEMLGLLAGRKRFRPPAAQVAVLVPLEAALLHRREWRRIYAAFAAGAEARIHTGFVSDSSIARDGVPRHVRVLAAPALEFVSPALREGLEAFTGAGGLLLTADNSCGDGDGNPAPPVAGAEELGTDLFDVFPLDRPATAEDLARLSGAIAERVARTEADACSWVFDVCCENLPSAETTPPRPADPDIRFDHCFYQHSSNWILPYLRAEDSR